MDNHVWHSCSKGERYRHISKFMHIKPEEVTSLCASELVFLWQWVFELQERETVQVIVQKEYFDLRLVNKQKDNPHKGNRREYARFFLRHPAYAVYNLVTELKGRPVNKIYLLTFDKFAIADKRARSENPLFIELRECEDLIHWIQEAQVNYRKALHTKHDFYVIPEPFGRRESRFEKLWSEFKQKVRKRAHV
ncbi:MAG TPA: hypothetical protein VLE49_00895 [Anaerolineales bacterium]|nr:hypothetical protein [Anaerolineales bacterium]